MCKVSTSLCLLLVVMLAAASLLAIEPTYAQTIPKPSTPNFFLKIADNSYNVPPTTTSYTDPYTGKTTTQTKPGYYVNNKTIEVTIKNQPFTPYTDASGNKIELYYNISVKPHYGGNWTYYPISYGETYIATNSDYSTRNFIYGAYANGGYAHGGYADTVSPSIGYIAPGGEVDFRVQAEIGHYHYEWVSLGGQDHPLLGGLVPRFVGQTSEWSNAETIKIPAANNSPAPSPTVPEFSSLILILLFAVGLLAVIMLKFKGRKVGAR